MWAFSGDEFGDALHHGVGCQGQLVAGELQAPSAGCDLFEGLLAAHVEDAGRLRERGGDLKQQRALAGAWVAADHHHRTRHEAAAEHPVEFAEAGRNPRLGLLADVGELRGALFAAGVAAVGACTFRSGPKLPQRVPRPAGGALALPLAVFRAAFGADERRFGLGHQGSKPGSGGPKSGGGL